MHFNRVGLLNADMIQSGVEEEIGDIALPHAEDEDEAEAEDEADSEDEANDKPKDNFFLKQDFFELRGLQGRYKFR